MIKEAAKTLGKMITVSVIAMAIVDIGGVMLEYSYTKKALRMCDRKKITIDNIVSGNYSLSTLTYDYKKSLGIHMYHPGISIDDLKSLPPNGEYGIFKGMAYYVDNDSNVFVLNPGYLDKNWINSLLEKELQYARDMAYKNFLKETNSE